MTSPAASTPAIEVGPAWAEILPQLPAVELSAGELFRSLPAAAFVADEECTSLDELCDAHEQGMLWVATVPPAAAAAAATPAPGNSISTTPPSSTVTSTSTTAGRTPIGFLLAYRMERHLFVQELDVAREWQGRGAAGKLMRCAEAFGRSLREGGCDDGGGSGPLLGLSLTTSRLTPWSYGWYARIGFADVPDDQLGPAHAKQVAWERRRWQNEFGRSRVLMCKRFDAEPGAEGGSRRDGDVRDDEMRSQKS